MFSSFQEKTYQTIDALFSGKKKGDRIDGKKESNMGDLESEGVVDEYHSVVKNSIEIECQGKKYAYHLGEVLNRKWSSDSFQNPKPKDNNNKRMIKGGDRLDTAAQHGGKEIQLQFCLFTINTDAIVPFLEFWLVPNAENVLAFPQSVFQVNGMEGGDDEEEHAAFLDVCRKKMMELGIFTTEEEDAFTTERMERDYHGFISAPPGQEEIVYVFYQLRPPIGAGNGIAAILDEMLNRHKVLETPVDAKLRKLFYTYPELLYIYGSPVSPIDSLVYGEDSTYDVSDEAPQEIPYCLYLCQDKTEFSQDFQEGKAVETITGNILRGIEEPHYLSPKDKYQIVDSTAAKLSRTEDEYGYFYYFTNELMGGEDMKVVKRYAVFVYNTDYRLDKYTLDTLKSADLDKRLVGGSFWKWNFKPSDWMKGGAQYLQFFYNPVAAKNLKNGDIIVKKEFTEIITDSKKRIPIVSERLSSSESSSDSSSDSDVPVKRPTLDIAESEPETEEQEAVEDIPEPESEEQEAVEDNANTEYASVYFQRDNIPLWCIKHRICFTCLNPESEPITESVPIKIEK